MWWLWVIVGVVVLVAIVFLLACLSITKGYDSKCERLRRMGERGFYNDTKHSNDK